MTNEFLYNFISQNKLAILSSVTPENNPEAALVGIAVTPDLKIIFDTVTDSRKYKNLIHNPRIAFVIGWNDEKTIQYEGVAIIPVDNELEEIKKIYFQTFPDGKQRASSWKNVVYFCVKPIWIRFSDYNHSTNKIVEMIF